MMPMTKTLDTTFFSLCAKSVAPCATRGSGLMLWIMPSPAWGFQLETRLHDRRQALIGEDIHGEDHPGNQ
jgi:hypothetical protein